MCSCCWSTRRGGAEVDFGGVWVVLAGVKTKCHMFAFRLSHSGKAVHRVYPTQAQEAFLEGHIDAFVTIGGVPSRHIRYDNLTAAVVRAASASRRAPRDDGCVSEGCATDGDGRGPDPANLLGSQRRVVKASDDVRIPRGEGHEFSLGLISGAAPVRIERQQAHLPRHTPRGYQKSPGC